MGVAKKNGRHANLSHLSQGELDFQVEYQPLAAFIARTEISLHPPPTAKQHLVGIWRVPDVRVLRELVPLRQGKQAPTCK